jgi:hypothetical protein
MKKLHLFRLSVVVLVAGLTFGSCDNGTSTSKDVLDGTTWESSSQEEVFDTEYTITGTLKFDSPDFELSFSYTPTPAADVAQYFPLLVKGTYTIADNNATLSLEVGGELNGTISGNNITFPGGEGEADIIYTKK